MLGPQENEFRRARDHALNSARRLSVEGRVWLVYELGATEYDHRGPALIFESDTAVRRVRNFPSSWRELSDEELETVSNSR